MHTDKIKSNKDQWPISILCVDDVENPKGVVQISHGMCEYKERYIDFMQYLNTQGYICVIHDHRGHGQSIVDQNDLGYFGKNGDIKMCEDLYQVNQWIKGRYPFLPIIMLGHSMGSMLARKYIKTYDDTISGLIICGSPSYNRFVTFAKTLTYLLSKIKGVHHRSTFINYLAFGLFNRKIKNAKSPHQWICSDLKVVEAYDQDPLCNFIFTLNGFNQLFAIMESAYSLNDWHITQQLPIHFISGIEDPCLINVKKFNQALKRLKQVGYQNVTSKLYDGMYHEILNEKNKEEVYQDISNWLDKILFKDA
ncbi:MAG: lysophospholipase [Erysipelotrichaceae bacterium]|nr:lysophospholipase [Erysipelotrichaceae bacterium]